MGQFRYGQAFSVFEELVRERPDSLDLKVNLAIAALNRDQGGKNALAILREVLAADANHVAARYCTGLLLIHAGSTAEALEHLRAVVAAEPNDAYARYFLASCLESDAPEQALEEYRRAADLDPYLYSAHYRIAQLARLQGRSNEAAEALKTFQQVKASPRGRAAEIKYTRMGPKAEAIAVGGEPTTGPAVPSGPLFVEPAVPLVAASEGVKWKVAPQRPTSLTACDINGDSRIDVFAADVLAMGEVHNAVLLQQPDRTFRLDRDHSLAKVPDVNAALWGDVDSDGRTDVYLCRRGANQLWRQTGPNQWQDATAATKTSGGEADTVDGALFDADHDGDLDLFLVNADGSNELLNNDRNGTFRRLAAELAIAGDGRPSRSVVVVDLDRDRDSDLVVLQEKPPHKVYWNERLWRYRPADGFDSLTAAGIGALVPGDVDADGQVELFGLTAEGLMRWRRAKSGEWTSQPVAGDTLDAQSLGQLALADFNGDGQSELLVGRASGWTVIGLGNDPSAIFRTSVGVTGLTLLAVDDSSGPAVVGMTADGPMLWAPGSGRLPFLAVTFTGKREAEAMRSNTSGIGVEAAVRVGQRWTARTGIRDQSGPGQSLQPWLVGVGGAEKADFVRIDWPDGVYQTELDLAANRRHLIAEEQRMPISCPIIFTWDGQKYRFITDFLGVGGLGYFVAPGEYATPDPTENILLPPDCLVPRNGRFEVKVLEPSEELTYLDHVSLVAYDLPAGWEMTLDERMGLAGPRPSGQPYFFRRMLRPIRAVNDRGADVTRQIAEADFCPAPPGEFDQRFIGRLEREHSLILTFDQPIGLAAGRPVLVMDAWIEFPFSRTLFGAWQAGAVYHAPTLEAGSGTGDWHVIAESFGLPGGMPRQLAVPLERLPAGAMQLRLRTNHEVYWDRLMIVDAEPSANVRRNVLPLAAANLREPGFPGRIRLDWARNDFDYEVRAPLGDARDSAGEYTRFGPVDELIGAADDAVAIFGPGEEIHLEFADLLPDLPAGWSRRFVLETVGWCKDMDLYTEHGGAVDPLPARDQSNDTRTRLHQRYNTRYQAGP
jgi:hypothetical protein